MDYYSYFGLWRAIASIIRHLGPILLGPLAVLLAVFKRIAFFGVFNLNPICWPLSLLLLLFLFFKEDKNKKRQSLPPWNGSAKPGSLERRPEVGATRQPSKNTYNPSAFNSVDKLQQSAPSHQSKPSVLEGFAVSNAAQIDRTLISAASPVVEKNEMCMQAGKNKVTPAIRKRRRIRANWVLKR